MPKGIRYSDDIKIQVLDRIKNYGITGNQASREFGVNVKAIYRWLKEETEITGVSWSAHNKLKRENEQLKQIIGHLTLEMNRPKKS